MALSDLTDFVEFNICIYIWGKQFIDFTDYPSKDSSIGNFSNRIPGICKDEVDNIKIMYSRPIFTSRSSL